MAAKKYIVQTFGEEAYEVEADRVEVNPANHNNVTLYKGEAVVAQENNAQRVYPKNG